MKSEYKAFLDELVEEERKRYHESERGEVPRSMICRAKCQSWTQKFVEKFPHLKRVAGFYGPPEEMWEVDDEMVGRTEHFWCVDVDGTIVDPTAEQFSPGLVYTPFDETKHKIQIGRCMNCGEYIYGLKSEGHQSCCGEDCAHELERHYNSL